MGRNLPSGTVTFLFTDVEGSTKLLHALGAVAYGEALTEHRRLLRDAFTRHGGVEVDTQGDAFFVAFPTAPGALAAALEATAALRDGPIRVRIGLHTGTPLLTDEGYIGPDVHKGARIAAAGHGGQVLVSAATAALLDGPELRDLGLHRLKDLTAAERIFQADPDDHPPLKTLHQTNLPVPATPFLGREEELADIGVLLADASRRLVTLTGPGGTGKTRLALQAAASAADAFPGGVWWVPLAALRDPALVLESAAQALGASGDLAEHIGDKKLLLLLDNFEHLTAAADGLAPVLASCPQLTLLVTSREPLHLAGEHEFSVDPLAPTEAVELFLTRALSVRRDFSANGEVALICERLDHLPLAIELAAARVKLLSPKSLLERLEQRLPLLAGGARDVPERQRTLRATIAWSHELLTAGEQRLFARLAVFRGGWSLEAAESVADADLDTLQSLIDKSLVRVRDNDRFWMLETIREFALEQLDASAEADEMRRRHAAFFMALAEEGFSHMRGAPNEWPDRLEAELDNFRAALDWLDAAGQAEERIRLAGALWKFWNMRGHFIEGIQRLGDALAPSMGPSLHRVRAGVGIGGLLLARWEVGEARGHLEEALEMANSLGDEDAMANAEFMLGYAFAEGAGWERARDLFESSLERFRRLGDDHYVLLVGRNLAWIYYELGQPERGQALYEETLENARAAGNLRMVSTTLQGLAWRAAKAGRWREAISRIEESYPINRTLRDPLVIASDLFRLAMALEAGDRTDAAAKLLGAAKAIGDEIGVAVEVDEFDTLAATLRGRLGADAFEVGLAAGAALSTDEAVELALEAAAPDRGGSADPSA